MYERKLIKSLLYPLAGGIMKRTENKSVLSIIAAVLVSLLAGCAAVPTQDDLFAHTRTYNGGGDGSGGDSGSY